MSVVEPNFYADPPDRTVLVLGSGVHAVALAHELAMLGFPVVLASEAPRELQRAGATDGSYEPAEAINGATLVKLSGEVGRFRATLRANGEELERTVGAVAAVSEPASRPLFSSWGLEPSSTILTVEAMKNHSPLNDTVRTVLLLDHPEGTGQPWRTSALLALATDLQSRGTAQCYLLSPQMKVADRGIERLYRTAREQGVAVLRPDTQELECEQGKVTVSFVDPLLDARVTLTPDMVVVGNEDVAPPELSRWGEVLGVTKDSHGWLQEDNLLRTPSLTNRVGLFVIGATSGPIAPAAMETAVTAGAEEIMRLLRDGDRFSPATRVEVDRNRCTHCLTCLRMCPHGAVLWDQKPFFSSWSCQECGICASECPAEALTLLGFAPEDIRGKIASSAGTRQPGRGSHIAVLCCEKSGGAALNSLDEHRRTELNVTTVTFPCAGNIKTAFMLNAFHLGPGAQGVLVLGCHTDNCRSSTGTVYARRRVKVVRDLLESIGWEPERIRFFSLASNMGARLCREIEDFRRELESLEPLPETAGERNLVHAV